MGCGGSKGETADQSTQNGTKTENAGTSNQEKIQEGKGSSAQDVKETPSDSTKTETREEQKETEKPADVKADDTNTANDGNKADDNAKKEDTTQAQAEE